LFRNRLLLSATLLAVLSIVLAAGYYGPMAAFVHAVKHEPVNADARQVRLAADDSALLQWIEQEAPAREAAAVDAVIDRIWKAIPGYAGRQVDVEATVAKAKAAGVKPGAADFPWVYKEVPPAVHLDDLPLAPIYRGNPAKPMVALMINVAWGNEYLPAMLKTLETEDVKATFFLDGSWLAKNKSVALDLAARGHELSNHAYSHPAMSKLSFENQLREIKRTEQLLDNLGVHNRWFAPPSGDYDERTVRAASRLGLRTVLWTLDTVDWKSPPPAAVTAKIAAKIGPGQLVLMHPTKTSRDALQGIIAAIRGKGLQLGTVSETLSEARIDQD